MELWNALPPIVRHLVVGVCFFVLGGVISFGYSYRPLHGALVFKVEALEARLDRRNAENLRLKDRLATFEADESTRIEPETFAQVESELAKTKAALGRAEKNIKSAEKKRRDAIKNADRWRERYESLRDQQAALSAAPEPRPIAPPAATSPNAGHADDAAPPLIPGQPSSRSPLAPRDGFSDGPGTRSNDAPILP